MHSYKKSGRRDVTGKLFSQSYKPSDLQNMRNSSQGLQEKRERSPFTLHNSRVNFVGVPSLPHQGPRAVIISETGERRSLELDATDVSLLFPNLELPTSSVVTSPPAAVQNSSPNELKLTQSGHQKLGRRSNKCRPPQFSPRKFNFFSTLKHREERMRAKLKIASSHAETQTDWEDTSNEQPPDTSQCNLSEHIPQPSETPQTSEQKVTLEDDVTTEPLDKAVSLLKLQELQIMPHRRRRFRTCFAELCTFASAISLITLITWLFTMFFEMQGFSIFFANCIEALRSLTVKKEPPTSTQLLIEFLRSVLPTRT